LKCPKTGQYSFVYQTKGERKDIIGFEIALSSPIVEQNGKKEGKFLPRSSKKNEEVGKRDARADTKTDFRVLTFFGSDFPWVAPCRCVCSSKERDGYDQS
jgi:hypothetical protein